MEARGAIAPLGFSVDRSKRDNQQRAGIIDAGVQKTGLALPAPFSFGIPPHAFVKIATMTPTLALQGNAIDSLQFLHKKISSCAAR